MSKNTTIPRPIIIFIRGLPGSGKSYLTAELYKVLGPDTVVLDPDAIDFEGNSYQSHKKQAIKEGVVPALFAYRYLRSQAYKAIAEHKIIIWNQPFTNLDIFNKMVANLRIQAVEHNVSLPIIVVEIEVSHDIAKERVENRKQNGGHGPSDETFTRFTTDYKSFTNNGYQTVTIQGDSDVSKSVDRVMNALQNHLNEM